MRRLAVCICFLFMGLFMMKAQNTDFSLDHVKSLGLKVVQIETVAQEEPTCDYVEAPEGCMGMTTVNATKVPCRVIITQSDETLYDSGEYEKSVSGATIKINGNTSAYFSVNENKPYKIKLQKKKDLLSRGDERYADKEWRLLKDALSLNTIIGLRISELLQFPWTPAYTPCNVFINGDYQGCYLLIESVKRNKDCRINVDKEYGYIIERDPYWWKEDDYFTTNYFAPYKGYRWTWKYPDEENVSIFQKISIKYDIKQTEKSIKDGTYEDYIDIESFARWILAQDILGSKDSGGTNIYVTKYDKNSSSLLEMPVLWDFDSNFQVQAGQFSKCHDSAYDYYFHDLFNSENRAFTQIYQQLWETVKPTILQDITDYITDYVNSEEGQALELSRELNIKRWNYEGTTTMEEDATEAIQWFNVHLPLLDENISTITPTAIRTIKKEKDNQAIYDLTGAKIQQERKGIYIKNHQKYVQR